MGDRELTAGEVWVREELELLLAARLSPRAVARFLCRSQQRTNAERARRPEAVARMRWWFAFGAAGWIALATGGVSPFRGRLRSGLACWAATAVMLDWHIGMLETEDGQPRNLSLADALTLLRAWLVPVVADSAHPAVVLLAGATDALDGPAARAGTPTRAGRDLEGLVDTCFSAAALTGAVRQGALPRSVAGLELARLGVGVAYTLAIYFGQAEAPARALVSAARLTTPVRVGGLLAAGCGRRRVGACALACGSLLSIAAVATAFAAGRTSPATLVRP